MCILAFITQYHPRFPFVLVSNRDEVLSRATFPLAVRDGLLWAVDGVAGGSWLGVHVESGRFATLTNCRRSPSAPLRTSRPVPQGDGWRGAATVEEVVQHTRVVRGTLQYEPPTSRGTIIKDYLESGVLPGRADVADCHRSLQPPFYAGYNLITCPSLYADCSAQYTTNRFHAQHAERVAPGTVHCLQNSFLDNWAEPKSVLLRDLLAEAVQSALQPLTAAHHPDATAPLSDSATEVVASALADTCLMARPNFELDEEKDPALRDLFSSTDPRSGFTNEEIKRYFSTSAEMTDGGAYERERFLQRNILQNAVDGYGTRVQSVVLVENVGTGKNIAHVLQRDIVHPADGGNGRAGPWVRISV